MLHSATTKQITIYERFRYYKIIAWYTTRYEFNVENKKRMHHYLDIWIFVMFLIFKRVKRCTSLCRQIVAGIRTSNRVLACDPYCKQCISKLHQLLMLNLARMNPSPSILDKIIWWLQTSISQVDSDQERNLYLAAAIAIVEVGRFPRMKAGGDALNNLALDCLCNLLKQIRGVRMRRDRGLCQYMQQLQLIKTPTYLKISHFHVLYTHSSRSCSIQRRN